MTHPLAIQGSSGARDWAAPRLSRLNALDHTEASGLDSLCSGPPCHAHEGTDLLVPIRRQRRIGAGSEAHRVAAVVIVDEEVPRAGLDPDRGNGVLPAAVRQILLIIAGRSRSSGEFGIREDRQ